MEGETLDTVTIEVSDGSGEL